MRVEVVCWIDLYGLPENVRVVPVIPVCLSVTSIGFVYVFVYRKLSPHFKSFRAGSHMLFLCMILHTMWSGKSMHMLCILPFGMLCLSVFFRGELGFLNCGAMCIVNKQFELLKFVFVSGYVDLQYDEISLIFTVVLCIACSRPWSVCEVVLVPYVEAVVVVAVICLLLLVLHVCMLREYDGARVTAMLV